MEDKKTNLIDSNVDKTNIGEVEIVPAKGSIEHKKKGNEKKDNNDSSSSNGKLKFVEPQNAGGKLIFSNPLPSFNFIEKQMRKNPKIAKLFINTRFSYALTRHTHDIPNSFYLTEVNGDETILDCLLKQGKNFFNSEELERRSKENSEILNIYLRNNVIPVRYDSSDEFVLTEVNGVTLLEKVLDDSDKIDLINLSQRIGRNKKIFNIVYNYFINKNEIDEKRLYVVIMLIKNLSGEKCLELYKNHFKNLKKYFDNSFLKDAILKSLDADTIKYLLDIGEMDLLKELNYEKQILKCDDGTIIFNLLLKKGIYTIEKNYFACTRPIIMKALIDCYDMKTIDKILEVYGEDVLLEKDSDGNTVLDYILNSVDSSYFLKILKRLSGDIRFARIMAKNENGFEYLLGSKPSILQSKCDGDRTILDCMMHNIKLKTAKEIIYKIPIFSSLDKSVWLYRFNNRSFLEILLQEGDKHSILLRLEMSDLCSDVEIQTILKLNGVDIEKEFGFMAVRTFNTDEFLKQQKNEIIKRRYSKYLEGILNDEQQRLINDLRNTFLKDGTSDVEIVELACNAFKYLLLSNYEYAVRDLKSLINIKRINPYFVMIKSDHSYASGRLLAVCNQYDIDSFNHELSHVILDYSKLREETSYFSNGVSINKDQFDIFLEECSKELIQIEEYIRKNIPRLLSEDDLAQKEVGSYNERIEDILKFAETSGNYSKEVIDYVRNNNSIEDEFKKYYTYVILKELLLDYVHDYKLTIIDMIDALKGGIIYKDGINLGHKLYHIGHGLKYYSKARNIFHEIIAQYNEIIKSPFRNQALNELENIVGSDFIEMLDRINVELYVIDPNAYDDIQIEKHK